MIPLDPFQTIWFSSISSSIQYYHRHVYTVRRTLAPLEIVTDFCSQFMNQLLTYFYAESGIRHHTMISYSKEEHGIVERANKEVNRHIRNVLFDKGDFKNWSRLLCMTERVLNTSVKQPSVSLLTRYCFVTPFQTDPSLLTQLDREVSDVETRSIREFVETLIERQAKIIDAAMQSQTSLILQITIPNVFTSSKTSPKNRNE